MNAIFLQHTVKSLRNCFNLSLRTGTCVLNRQIGSTPQRLLLNARLRRIGSNSEKERLLALKDKVPESYKIIYRAPMENYLWAAKNVSTVSAALITMLACNKYISEVFPAFNNLNFHGLVSHESDFWYFAAGFILINIAIRYFVSIYVKRIYKLGDKYIAVYDSQIPFLSLQHQFQAGEAIQASHKINPWRKSIYDLGGKSTLLLLDYFKTPIEYHEMIGPKFKHQYE